MHKRLSLEMGGKNAMIVFDDADLDLALDGVLWGAFGTTGQRCTATSRLILQDGIHDEFLEPARRPRARAQARRRPEEGHRRRPAHQRERRVEKVERYVDIGQAEGADLLCGGRRADGQGTRQRLLLRADDLRARASRACGSSRRRSSARCFR